MKPLAGIYTRPTRFQKPGRSAPGRGEETLGGIYTRPTRFQKPGRSAPGRGEETLGGDLYETYQVFETW